MRIVNFCNRIIEYSFYALFFFVPLALASNTSELFEFNKMWLTYGISLLIAGAWGVKIILQKSIVIQRTPLDIPILLFLTSQVISTVFSWDSHVSFWGYYSRFNGGLLSIITYIFLYYALVSNLSNLDYKVFRLLFVSLLAGLVVTLWGLPSHFGYDPTCLLFRGTLDVSCWTEDFQPKVRIFSTLGQPAWLAAYLAILIPISIAFSIQKTRNTKNIRSVGGSEKLDRLKIRNSDSLAHRVFRVFFSVQALFIILSALFYLALLYTSARSGFLAMWVSLAFFFLVYILIQKDKIVKSFPNKSLLRYWYLLVVFVVLVFITFFVGQPFSQFDKFTFNGIKTTLLSPKTATTVNKDLSEAAKDYPKDGGGTESGIIRQIVWQGAINAWKNYPIFGTGVETFAFAYYKYKPPQHNLTSEWNFLYNKAHNEYLNYLATTGIFGLGSYLLMIGYFLFLAFHKLKTQSPIQSGTKLNSAKPKQNSKLEKENFSALGFDFEPCTLSFALLASYISILITNFFGFSVVITNIYLFLIPAFVFILQGTITPQKQFVFPRYLKISNFHPSPDGPISNFQWIFILLILFAICYFLFNLIKFWVADTNYSYGHNLDRAGQHREANSYLRQAVNAQNNEPVFKDALAINDANVVIDLLNTASTNATDTAKLAPEFAQEAINLSNDITTKHPNNVVFWKNRVRVFYMLSQAGASYLEHALSAIKNAAAIAPNDATISYNLGVIYGQAGDVKNGISALEHTIKLKPDYKDAHYALGLFYHDQAVNEKENVVDRDKLNKAIAQLQYILDNLDSNDRVTQETLKEWKKLKF